MRQRPFQLQPPRRSFFLAASGGRERRFSDPANTGAADGTGDGGAVGQWAMVSQGLGY